MKDLKIGDRLTIQCYKHNGKIHRAWDEAIILNVSENLLVCANNKTKVTEDDGRSHKTNEIAILYFYKDKWFNVISQFKKKGLFYYCNIASPYLIDDGVIKYIDYDLDLRVFPNGTYKILDQNEYKYHKKIMRYSDELDLILNNELKNLIEMKENNEGPFNPDEINKYLEQYKSLIKQ